MNPDKVRRDRLGRLTDLPNIGPAMAKDLLLLGVHEPRQLVGMSPFQMYETLCEKTGVRHDPCVIDVFMSITGFMAGDDPQPWWAYTPLRKQAVAEGRLPGGKDGYLMGGKAVTH